MTNTTTEKKTRVVPQLSKDIRTLNSLRAKRAKVAELDDQIADMELKVAAQLNLPGQGDPGTLSD